MKCGWHHADPHKVADDCNRSNTASMRQNWQDSCRARKVAHSMEAAVAAPGWEAVGTEATVRAVRAPAAEGSRWASATTERRAAAAKLPASVSGSARC